MTLSNRFLPVRFLSLAVIISLLNVSCEKDNITAKALSPDGISPSGLTLLPPLQFIVWTRQPDLPFPDLIPGDVPYGLVSPQSFSINGKGYLCGGMTITSLTTVEELKELWQFDTATHTWTQRAGFPGPTPDEAANFVIGNDAYILVNNNLWQYNQLTNSWASKASLPTVARANASSFAIDGMGYVGFGRDITNNSGDLTDFWQYNPSTDTWLQKNSFRASRRESAASFVIDNKGFICSGANVAGTGTTYLTDLWQYDPVYNDWIAKPNFPAAGRADAVGLSGLGHGFVATGANGSSLFNDCWQYNDSTGQWTALPTVGGGVRTEAGGFAMGNNLYIAGGTAGLSNPDGKVDFWTLYLSK